MAKRIAIVKREDCNPEGCGDYLCMRVCPVNRKGEDCITKDASSKKAAIDETLCIGCGICINRCPFQAIDIINLPEELNQEPIHRYGTNGFALFSLPIPIFGKVVGVLGVNGIGKSTAIKILSGVLNPNLGRVEPNQEATDKELIDFFKGTEAQLFFEKIRDKNIKVSYKPQNVDTIPKRFSGTVQELLKKADQTGRFDKVTELLDLKKILDHNIAHISGGELQRVAIAATVMKDANLFVFDEPTSFLDIKQRIKVAKFIKDLADENTAVLVIEHDLIILDYMTDLIHLMYGKEEKYGIVSLPKTTKAGINIYLEGFLKEENIRFRDYEIKFSNRPAMTKSSNLVMCSWENIKKSLDKFKLSAEKGAIFQNDVIGILGENGIGKTSFVKVLASVIEPDQGNVDQKVRVAYKPQYLETGDELVMSILHKAIETFSTQLIKPLNLEPLFYKRLNELSGGQLQRVAIAHALSQDADLFLLDEPSAYLDVEQRVRVAKIIGDLMAFKGTSCMVVDHDLLFIDYLSKRLIVFEGEPAVSGSVKGPFGMQEGMNKFLLDLNITFRRDPESNRPRANKLDSQMDKLQKSEHKLYYI